MPGWRTVPGGPPCRAIASRAGQRSSACRARDARIAAPVGWACRPAEETRGADAAATMPAATRSRAQGNSSMTAIDDFFADLDRRGHEPMLRRLSATVRWDILDGDRIERRLVRVDQGGVRGGGR